MTDYEYKLYLMDFLHMKIAPRTQEEYSVSSSQIYNN